MQPSSQVISAHIFYNVVDSRPLVVECLSPLIDTLEKRGLIENFFFIRYWLGGSHIRLRLQPRLESDAQEIRELVETYADSFLLRRPSLFDIDPEKSQPYMRRLFIAEYGDDLFDRFYGVTGHMPIYPNNSVQYFDYEPEYGRYGGSDGVTVAENHFHYSSRTVLQVLRETNSHVRPVLLGQAMQLMLVMAKACQYQLPELALYFKRYSLAWRKEYKREADPSVDLYESAYRRQRRRIEKYIDRMQRVTESNSVSDSSTLRQWYLHCQSTREMIQGLYSKGLLLLDPPAESLTEGIRRVFISYMHMTNNRLGVRIVDEGYLAYLLSRALEEASEIEAAVETA